MRFSHIYLFSWAYSSRPSACFLLYVPWPQCPLPPPPSVYLRVQIYVCACTFTPLLLLPVFFRSVSKCLVYEHVITACVFTHPLSRMKWEPELVSGDEWYLLGYICFIMCVPDMLGNYCTHKKSKLSRAVAEHNAWKQLRLCRTQQSENKSFLSLFFCGFFYRFMDICTNHTKINIVSIRLYALDIFFFVSACRISDVRTFLYNLSHWFSAKLIAYILLNAERVTWWIWRKNTKKFMSVGQSMINFVQETSSMSAEKMKP